MATGSATGATLTNLAGISSTAAPSTATLIITDPFSTSGGGAVPTTCTAIVAKANTDTDINNFLSSYRLLDKPPSGVDVSITDKLLTFQRQLAPATVDQLQDITQNGGYSNVNTFITGLQTTYLPVIRLADSCLREATQVDRTAYNAAKAKAEESNLRLKSILTPEQHLSYYDGWFPLIRPMSESALFGIFGAALFMLILSILVFLRMTGVQIQLQIPEIMNMPSLPTLPPSWLTLPPYASYYIYGGIAAGLIGTGVAYKFGYI
jgi:hypothetical protein